MLQEFDLHYKCPCNRDYSLDGSTKDVASCDFDAKFEFECKRFTESLSQSAREREEVRILELQERSCNMITEACSQVEKRMPSNKDVFKKLQLLSSEPSIKTRIW
ncbi:hypothetical protein PoB_000469500 [Plakobranchus ocellatus]|uniref:Uncharacterized protein n=1 Tax=Plakobranchus ocellatus TaxID=259542 RepID=A0AAV3Y6U2_9GAST|nr:hypothetical protein PoB_000469500 [Plakobranchus ocellatus]